MTGFSHFLGTTFNNPVLKTYGNLEARRTPTWVPGWYLILVTDDDGRTAFEFAMSLPTLFDRCWNCRLGWKLGNLNRDKTENIPVVGRCWPFASHRELDPSVK